MKSINFDVYFEKNTDLSGIFLTQKENIFWLTGFSGSFAWGIILANGSMKLITDGRYAEKTKKISEQNNNLEFWLYDKDFEKNFGKNLSGNFEIEDSVSVAQLGKIKKFFPGLDFVPQKSFIEGQREIKTKSELDSIAKAQAQVDTVLEPLMRRRAKAGVSEKELAFEIEMVIRSGGNFGISFEPIVAFGENSALPHHHPSSRKLKTGDNILVDCGAEYQGYASDMTRNFCLGEPSPEYREKFEHCLEAQQKTLEKYKIGAKVWELENFCRKILGPEEKYFIHSLGHGVGLEIHEAPIVSSRSKEILKRGKVVTCEPGIYYPGKFGIRIEDILAITDNEPWVFSQTDKNLIIL